MDALRLLVGRGGDPERSDNYGNTALHLAAARGHMNCCTFLVNFGVNVFSLDIDHHTPQELAAMNDCTDILRYLDSHNAKLRADDPKKVKKQQEKAEKDALKLGKSFQKLQLNADKQKSRKEKSLDKDKKSMDSNNASAAAGVSQGTMSFSDMVAVKGANASNAGNKSFYGTIKSSTGTVFKKSKSTPAAGSGSMRTNNNNSGRDASFKVTDLETDGKKTVRTLSGLKSKRGNDILFIAPSEDREDLEDRLAAAAGDNSNRTALDQINFGGSSVSSTSTNRTAAAGSIFDRPGFGSVAFRGGTMATTLLRLQNDNSTGDLDSLDEESEDEVNFGREGHSEEDVDQYAAIETFLTGIGLSQYAAEFRRQKIDLKALMLLDEESLVEMDVAIGPRKKILNAIEDRKKALGAGGAIQDSAL